MRSTFFVGALLLSGLSLTTAASAAYVYPWCAKYAATGGACSFDTFQQCLDDISGKGGVCSSNPSLSGYNGGYNGGYYGGY